MGFRRATYTLCVACFLALLTCARLSAADISVQHTSDMSFGQIISDSFGGTVAISTTGVRTCSGVAALSSSSSSQAVFLVNGDPNTAYAVILPGSVALTGTGADMTLDTFVSDPADSGLLDGTGAQILYVGATLHVGANQQVGSYSGTIDISVAYN